MPAPPSGKFFDLPELSLPPWQARSQPEILRGGGQEQIMEGQNFFVYSDENEEIKCL